MVSCQQKLSSPERLHSLDAFRGLDMLCIIGLDTFMQTLERVFPGSATARAMSGQFGHVRWEGCHLYDLIFPLFVFISGMAMAYSINRRIEQGRSRALLTLDVVKRCVILVLLGMVVNGLMDLKFDTLRYPSVLGLIGISTMIGGLAVIWLRSTRLLVASGLVVLAVTGVLQFFGGDFTPSGSVNAWLDQSLLPGRLHDKYSDPEGVLCVFSASFLAISGYLGGVFIQRLDGSPYKTVLMLGGTGVLLIAAAMGLSWLIPVIKKMWTPSFMLLACGWAFVVFAVLYLIVDLWQCRRFGYVFEVIGFNALAIYVGQAFINFGEINARLFGGLAGLWPDYAPLILAGSVILLKWWALWVMERNRFRVRIG